MLSGSPKKLLEGREPESRLLSKTILIELVCVETVISRKSEGIEPEMLFELKSREGLTTELMWVNRPLGRAP